MARRSARASRVGCARGEEHGELDEGRLDSIRLGSQRRITYEALQRFVAQTHA